ncbi:MAG: MFS transporter [Ferruginibacter sp.]|nr:MFS transporter [Cytophagales bacterium]
MEATPTVTQKATYPKSIPYIIGNEAAERFSFYGMRSILATFLVAQFFNPAHIPALDTVAKAQANEKVHSFVALAYGMTLLGGLLADWFFGKYRVILYISLVYCVGHLTLALFDQNLTGFSTGLILIAFGAGCIKACVSANVGDQFDESNKHLMAKMYGWFYFSINAGSLISNYFIPIIYNDYGASWAFGVPGILMALATLIFWLGRKKYIRIPPAGLKGITTRELVATVAVMAALTVLTFVLNRFFDLATGWLILINVLLFFAGYKGWIEKIAPAGIQKGNFLFTSLYALSNPGKKQPGQSWIDAAADRYDADTIEGVKAVYRVLIVFSFVPVFWALWDQCLSEWVLQAQDLDLRAFGRQWLPEQVQTVNPFFLLTMIPIFNYGVYPFFEKIGIKTTLLRRFGAGLFLTALSFVVIAMIQERIDAGQHPSVWWQILAYAILAAGEVLVSITGLEYAYTYSPPSMKSTMTAIFYLTVTVGNLFVSMVNNSIANKGFFAQLEGASYYWFFFGLMSVFSVVFMLVSGRMKEKAYIIDR